MLYISFTVSFVLVMFILRTRHHKRRKELFVVQVNHEACARCRSCIRVCKHDALEMSMNENGQYLQVDTQRCAGCGKCTEVCPFDAIKKILRDGNS